MRKEKKNAEIGAKISLLNLNWANRNIRLYFGNLTNCISTKKKYLNKIPCIFSIALEITLQKR